MGWMEDMLGGVLGCAEECEAGINKAIEDSFNAAGLEITSTFNWYMNLVSTEYKNAGKKLLGEYEKSYTILKDSLSKAKDPKEIKEIEGKIVDLGKFKERKQEKLKGTKAKQEDKLKNKRDAYIRNSK